MAEFEITHTTKEAKGKRVSVLNLSGQLDAHTFPSLQKELEELSDQSNPLVVLDCNSLEYISSAGLGVLNKMTRDFRTKAGDIRLAQLPGKIANIIQLLGFDQVLKIFPATDQAVESFGDEE